MLNLKEKIKFIIMTCERWGANFYYEEASQRRWHACEFFFLPNAWMCIYIYIVFRFFCQTPIPAATLTADMKQHEYKVDSYKYLNLPHLVHIPFSPSPLAFWVFSSLHMLSILSSGVHISFFSHSHSLKFHSKFPGFSTSAVFL